MGSYKVIFEYNKNTDYENILPLGYNSNGFLRNFVPGVILRSINVIHSDDTKGFKIEVGVLKKRIFCASGGFWITGLSNDGKHPIYCWEEFSKGGLFCVKLLDDVEVDLVVECEFIGKMSPRSIDFLMRD